MSEQTLPLIDGPVTFAGAVSLQQTGAGVHPWRLVHDDLLLYEPTLRQRAAAAAGVRLTFVSDTSQVALTVSPGFNGGEGACTFDLLVDGAMHQRQTLEKPEGMVCFTDLPEGEHRLELYLPHGTAVAVQRLTVDKSANVKPWQDPRPKWLVYGSSITQAGAAAGPSETWPALVANRFDLNLTCLGYGGNCHLEPVVTRMMRDLPADYISLCLGINVMGSGSYNERTFRAMVLGTILTLRDGHPETPMVCVSPIANPPRENTPNRAGMTLVQKRELIAEAVAVLRERGDANLHYIDGLTLFGHSFVHHMPDQLHPDAEGYRVLAERYAQVVMPTFGLTEACEAAVGG
ncbi:MAG: SGNH/GDSL hydrolase family protein [Phycisphaeraceae bacterium]